ncbi:MAG: phosphohistidine phosphatase SixA [Myxococcota bacterium]|nr:phosphohistidine phosphatase SixA [Myxococcota bacterium]
MELYVVRHGEAAPAAAGEADAGRSLTDRGRREVAGVGAGLRSLGVGIDRILVSPLRRAQETADIVARELAADTQAQPPILETLGELDGRASAATMLAVLDRFEPDASIAIIGHMPGLGDLVALATAEGDAPGVSLGTASVAHLEFAGRPDPGAGRLRWLRSAGQMAGLAHPSPKS